MVESCATTRRSAQAMFPENSFEPGDQITGSSRDKRIETIETRVLEPLPATASSSDEEAGPLRRRYPAREVPETLHLNSSGPRLLHLHHGVDRTEGTRLRL